MQDVIKKLGKQIILGQTNNGILIIKEVFGVSAKITFLFTPKTKKLYSIVIKWDNTRSFFR